MSQTGRRYFKRTHAAGRTFEGVCFVVALVLGSSAVSRLWLSLNESWGFSPSSFVRLLGISPPWFLWMLVVPVVSLPLGLGALRLHRGVFLEREPRTVTVYWGWSLPWGKAWPWWRVGTRSPGAQAHLVVHYLESKELLPSCALVLSGDGEPLVLFSGLDYSDTRDKAEQIAHHLELRLRDSTQDARGVEEPAAEGPPGRAIPWTASVSENETRVVYLPSRRPPTPHTRFIVRVMLIMGGAAAMSVLLWWSNRDRDLMSLWLLSPLPLIPLFWVLVEEYAQSLSHVLRGSRNELTVESVSFFGRKARRFSRTDVRQIGIVFGVEPKPHNPRRLRQVSHLLVRGSGVQLTLVANLPRAELRVRAQELSTALGLEEGTSVDPRRALSG